MIGRIQKGIQKSDRNKILKDAARLGLIHIYNKANPEIDNQLFGREPPTNRFQLFILKKGALPGRKPAKQKILLLPYDLFPTFSCLPLSEGIPLAAVLGSKSHYSLITTDQTISNSGQRIFIIHFVTCFML